MYTKPGMKLTASIDRLFGAASHFRRHPPLDSHDRNSAWPLLKFTCTDATCRGASPSAGRLPSTARPWVSTSLATGCACCSSPPATASATSCNRSEEHTSELQSIIRISYAVFLLKKKKNKT